MINVIVVEFMSLDGVVQAPGDPNEDPDGFPHGGWSRPYFDDHRRYIPDVFSRAGGFLFGRRTYEIFSAYWPTVPSARDPIARALNEKPKYVASSTLTEAAWQPATVVRGDLAAAIDDVRTSLAGDLVVVGSWQLAQSLIEQDVIDEYQLWLHPVVLGAGKQLFGPTPAPSYLELVDSRTTGRGIVILTYRPTRGAGRDAPAVGMTQQTATA